MLTIGFTRREQINDPITLLTSMTGALLSLIFYSKVLKLDHQMRRYEALRNKGVKLDDLMARFSAKLENS
jgi:hypothetical protein